ncbi:GPCR kinase [Tanacetum coccineum]
MRVFLFGCAWKKALNLLKKGLLVLGEAMEASKRRRSMLSYRIQQLSKDLSEGSGIILKVPDEPKDNSGCSSNSLFGSDNEVQDVSSDEENKANENKADVEVVKKQARNEQPQRLSKLEKKVEAMPKRDWTKKYQKWTDEMNIRVILHSIHSDDGNPTSANIKQALRQLTFINERGYGNDITLGSALILDKVLVFSPKPSMHYLNITMRYVVKVFHKDTVLGSGSGVGGSGMLMEEEEIVKLMEEEKEMANLELQVCRNVTDQEDLYKLDDEALNLALE